MKDTKSTFIKSYQEYKISSSFFFDLFFLQLTEGVLEKTSPIILSVITVDLNHDRSTTWKSTTVFQITLLLASKSSGLMMGYNYSGTF